MVGNKKSGTSGGASPTEKTPDGTARRRADEVFGDVLPDTTADERDLETAGSDSDSSYRDSWYLENRPPHHDR